MESCRPSPTWAWDPGPAPPIIEPPSRNLPAPSFCPSFKGMGCKYATSVHLTHSHVGKPWQLGYEALAFPFSDCQVSQMLEVTWGNQLVWPNPFWELSYGGFSQHRPAAPWRHGPSGWCWINWAPLSVSVFEGEGWQWLWQREAEERNSERHDLQMQAFDEPVCRSMLESACAHPGETL